jgi:hypothetical protein
MLKNRRKPMEHKTEKPKRPWARAYLLGVRILCLGVLGVMLYLFATGHGIAAIIVGVSSPILEKGIYRCPYCWTRLNPRQWRLPPHCICPECHREL